MPFDVEPTGKTVVRVSGTTAPPAAQEGALMRDRDIVVKIIEGPSARTATLVK